MSVPDARAYRRWLSEGLQDFLGLWQFIREEQERRGLAFEDRYCAEVRQATLALLRDMLDAGWIALGDYNKQGFTPLALSAEQVISRVDSEWTSSHPHFDMEIWFGLMPFGKHVAQTLDGSPDQQVG